MSSILIVGAGQAGLQLALGLLADRARGHRRLEPDARRTSTTAR